MNPRPPPPHTHTHNPVRLRENLSTIVNVLGVLKVWIRKLFYQNKTIAFL